MSKSTNSYVNAVGLMISYMSMGFFFYDMILALPFDWSIISGKRQRRWPQIFYFGAKIFYIAYVSITLALNFARSEIDCQTTFDMLEMLMGFTTITASILLACRTICVFHGTARTVVLGVVAVLAACLTAAWMQGVTDVTNRWDPASAQLWTNGACVNLDIAMTYWVKYVVTIVFDAVILGLTIFGIVRMNGTSHIGKVLIRQGIAYFLLTFAANIIITVLTALKLSPLMSLFFAVPQATVCVICACRLYVELAEESKVTHLSSGYNPSTSYGSSNVDSYGKPAGFVQHDPLKQGAGSSTPSSGSETRMGVTVAGKPSMAYIDDIEKQQQLADSYDIGNTNLRGSLQQQRRGSSSFSGQDRFVEALSEPANDTSVGVHMEQQHTIEVDSLPAYMRDVHPFSNNNSTVFEREAPSAIAATAAADASMSPPRSSSRASKDLRAADQQSSNVDSNIRNQYPRLLSRTTDRQNA